MTAPVRWLLVALVAVLVVTPTVVVRVLPASRSDLSASALAAKIRASARLGWSGEVHTRGTLAVPAAQTFGGVARLLGTDSDLRVWWHDPEHWRVDRTRASGESDLVRDATRTIRWSYESRKATITRYSEVRLPAEVDVLPSTLAARMLQGARATELTRLPAVRVAGHSSAGLRLTPAGTDSTISRVDVWADEGSGIPTRVEVYAAGTRISVLSTAVTTLDVATPTLASTQFDFPEGITVTTSYALDDAAGANAFAPFAMPDSVAGMKRRGNPADLGAVGVYGRGPASVIVIPLRRGISRDLYRQLAQSKQSHVRSDGIALAVGPLSVLLTRGRVGSFRLVSNFLFAGTLTPTALDRVSADLQDHVTVTNR